MEFGIAIIMLLFFSQIFLIVLHIITLRIIRNKKANFSPLLIAVKCALLGNIPLLIALWLLLAAAHKDSTQIVTAILYSLIVYNGMAYSYCHIFNMSETARRIRILYELKLSDGSKYEDISNKYRTEDMLNIRLERLKDMGQISKLQGRFVLKSPLLYRVALLIINWGFLLKYNLELREQLRK